MSKKISAVYIDNSKTFTTFTPVYIVVDEEDFKIRIGRTLLNSEKTKGFIIRVEGMKRNVYLTIKTPRKTFEFRDISYENVKDLEFFTKEYKQRKKKIVDKSVNDAIYKSAVTAAAAANTFNEKNANIKELVKPLDVKAEVSSNNNIKLETFIPRYNVEK